MLWCKDHKLITFVVSLCGLGDYKYESICGCVDFFFLPLETVFILSHSVSWSYIRKKKCHIHTNAQLIPCISTLTQLFGTPSKSRVVWLTTLPRRVGSASPRGRSRQIHLQCCTSLSLLLTASLCTKWALIRHSEHSSTSRFKLLLFFF